VHGHLGPGATNLVTPIADAHMDSVPLVAITGQVRPPLIGTDGFQEADISGITMPVTKHNFLVTDAAEIAAHDRRGLPPGDHRPAGPGAGGHPEGRRCRRTTHFWPPELDLPGLPAHPRRTAADREAARLIAGARRPGVLRRRWRDQGGRRGGTAGSWPS
jgi:acetolactate synthase-1/2/3 large subunit